MKELPDCRTGSCQHSVKRDETLCSEDVCFLAVHGPARDCVALLSLTQLYGPAVRRKRASSRRRWVVLHQCIRPLIGALCSWPSWISARMRPHYRTGLIGPVGSPVFASAGKTEPPSRLILSQTSAGELLGYIVVGFLISRSAIKSVGWSPHRSSCFRSSGHEPERSRQFAPVCWRARWPARYDAAASWQLRASDRGRGAPGSFA